MGFSYLTHGTKAARHLGRRWANARRITGLALCLVSLVLVSLALAALSPFTAIDSAAISALKQTAIPKHESKQASITRLVNRVLHKSHYHRLNLNDDFSAKVLEKYLEQLDPGKIFFLQKDIQHFSRFKTKLDDSIRTGTLQRVYTIFRTYRTRVEQRGEFALKRLQQDFDFNIDEHFVLDRAEVDWANSVAELDDIWRKRIKNDILNARLAQKDTAETMQTLTNRYTHLVRQARQQTTEDVYQLFMNAYVTSLEPHTSYFSPRATENFNIDLRLSLEGIGAVLQTDNEYTIVRRVLAGGPAALTGQLAAEDRIIGVGQEQQPMVDVIGWRLDDVVELIRGTKDTIVRLEILPGEQGLQGPSEVIEIQRDTINLKERAAKKYVIESQTAVARATIGVIELPSFYIDFDSKQAGSPNYRSTTRDVKKLLYELEQDGIDGLIIDLRGNGGGALTEAIALTGLFIKKGPVVQIKDNRGNIDVEKDVNADIAYAGPLAVLVDRYSASASEIFAAAIQDYQRGIIVGESTFGKGSVQNLIDLNHLVAKNAGNKTPAQGDDIGQIKVTVAQFFRVNGASTQYRGVSPDLIFSSASNDHSEFGERAHDNALPWSQIKKANFQPFKPGQLQTALAAARPAHLKRINAAAEFEFAKQLSEFNHKRRTRKSITLHEEHRREYRRAMNVERLSIENKKRRALKQAIFTDIETLDEHYAALDEQRQRAAVPHQPDFFLGESGRILTDMIHFSRTDPTQPNALAKQSQH